MLCQGPQQTETSRGTFPHVFSPVSLASITGSAVCAFYMDDIEKAFSGKFKEQRNSESVWTPVPDEQVPKPR